MCFYTISDSVIIVTILHKLQQQLQPSFPWQFFFFPPFQVLILLQRTNNDWWQVRKGDATEGFVPANYVKEVEPKVVQKVVKQAVKVPEKVKVKKTIMKKEVVKKKKEKSSQLRRAPSGKTIHFNQMLQVCSLYINKNRTQVNVDQILCIFLYATSLNFIFYVERFLHFIFSYMCCVSSHITRH